LFATEHPYYCPHGRPIIVQMPLDTIVGLIHDFPVDEYIKHYESVKKK